MYKNAKIHVDTQHEVFRRHGMAWHGMGGRGGSGIGGGAEYLRRRSSAESLQPGENSPPPAFHGQISHTDSHTDRHMSQAYLNSPKSL